MQTPVFAPGLTSPINSPIARRPSAEGYLKGIIVPENEGAFGKLLSVLRSQRTYVPSTLTFPQLDLAAASERLRLVERG